MARPVSLYWFRQDLRLADNPALTAAANAARCVALQDNQLVIKRVIQSVQGMMQPPAAGGFY